MMNKMIRKILFLFLLLIVGGQLKAQQLVTTPEKSKHERKIYQVVEITVHDSLLYDEYKRKIAPVLKKFGGHYLVRSGAAADNNDPDTQLIPGEGGWKPDRIVIVVWDSMEQMQKFVNSEEYKAVYELRKKAATSKSLFAKEYIAP